MSLKATVAPVPASGVIVVSLCGELTLKCVPTVRNVLLKSLAQAPEAVVVDLTRLRVPMRSRLTVFPVASRTQPAPPVPLLLCGASDRVRAMARVLGDVAVYDTRAHAVAAVRAAQVRTARRVSAHLAATPMAPAAARGMVDAACRSWHLEHLRGPATLVISELVSNAVRHAATDMDLSAALGGDYLHLSVRDGSARPPVATDVHDAGPVSEHGHGLYLVAAYSIAWGSNLAGDGKTVWATLRATRAATTKPASAGRVPTLAGPVSRLANPLRPSRGWVHRRRWSPSRGWCWYPRSGSPWRWRYPRSSTSRWTRSGAPSGRRR
jgi:anti-sigma regulatory factor (Ser/Thr protein kinase)